ncbi:MAG: NAD(P)/FAD-dependent oxidoreductase [Gammaproteobacteria bacterium]|nr:NAD(P)/FAD-dependent oxidoreductase [Gammaproteobacteria bacterium]NVK89006.1 NAD(P)/FAD-dependent oxidoreductase [Gammaproteobacteria bacterium]
MKNYDAIIIGAGAAGLMCAISAASRNKRVLVLEHARKVGRKILMSGGGRCNFTNMYTEPDNFLSHNPHFCKSALSQYTQWDFIDLVQRYNVPYHEKTLGQLFCDHSSKDIVNLLLQECQRLNVDIQTGVKVTSITRAVNFKVTAGAETLESAAVVIATGGLSIPSMGPHGFGYQVAEEFGLPLIKQQAALVPFVMNSRWQNAFVDLAGSSLNVTASNSQASFQEGMLFTHKGLSGPAILQISSYWKPGESVTIDCLPGVNVQQMLLEARQENPNQQLKTWLAKLTTKRMAEVMCRNWFQDERLQNLSNKDVQSIHEKLTHLTVYPESTEGYKTAEVTLGGVDTAVLSSKSMMVRDIPGLYFIGEVVDVTGHLGGFNFQWAWSSGWAAGQAID